MTNVFSKAVHFGMLSRDQGEEALRLAGSLGILCIPPDDATTRRAFEWTLSLGRAAAYNSFYLTLAEDLGCEL